MEETSSSSSSSSSSTVMAPTKHAMPAAAPRNTLETLWQRRNELPPGLRPVIREELDPTVRRNTGSPDASLARIERRLCRLLEGPSLQRRNATTEASPEADPVHLLGTEAELTLALECFPRAVWYPLHALVDAHAGVDSCYTRQHWNEYIHLIPVAIPVFARLGRARHPAHERGGLLGFRRFRDFNLLRMLCATTGTSGVRQGSEVDRDCRGCLIRLHELGLWHPRDVVDMNLLGCLPLFRCPETSSKALDDARFRYLVDVCPVVLSTVITIDHTASMLPVRYAAAHRDLSVFRRVLEAGLEHFANEYGFVFYGDDDEGVVSAYHLARARHGELATDRALREVLGWNEEKASRHASHRCGGSLAEALVRAAGDPRIPASVVLDLLRMEPRVLVPQQQRQQQP